MNQVDIAVVLPGSASLGAYQAGAAAALIAGHNELRRRGMPIALPAWGGASAGATVALLAAHTLANGLDPVKVFREAWVEGVDLDVLTTGSAAPLGLEGLRSAFRRLMVEHVDQHRSDSPVEPTAANVHVALTTLRGYRYQLHALGAEPTDAVTYADWTQFTYSPGTDPSDMFDDGAASPIDAVLASVANPVAFPPVLLDRSDSEEEYRRRGLIDVSEGADSWWFSDGGLVQSRPVHRTLSMIPGSPTRVRCAVIDPRSEGPTTGTTWSDPDHPADWLGSVVRAMSIFPAQILSDELRRLDEENQARAAVAELAASLQVADPEAFRRWAQSAGLDSEVSLEAALLQAAGLGPSRHVRADVIHPRLVVEDGYVPQLLAGEQLGDFAGFLSQELRHSDFALGYASSRRWWQIVLEEEDWPISIAAMLDHLDAVGPPPWKEINRGEAEVDDLGMRDRAGLVRVALRAVRAAITGG